LPFRPPFSEPRRDSFPHTLMTRMFESEGSRSWAREGNGVPSILPGDISYQELRQATIREEAVCLDLENQIKVLQERLLASRIQYSRLATQIAPIRRLPDELLSKVFLDASLRPSFKHHREVLSLMLVCSKWKELALDTPLLWTDIDLLCRMRGSRAWKPDPDRLAYWLSLSKGVPLDLKIFLPIGPPGHSQFVCDLLSGTLLRECKRWKSLRLDGDQTLSSFKRALSSAGKDRERKISVLKSVCFGHIYSLKDNIFEEMQAPQVVELRLNHVHFSRKFLVSLFSSLPSIETLELIRCAVSDRDGKAHPFQTSQLNRLDIITWYIQSGLGYNETGYEVGWKLLWDILAVAPGVRKLRMIAGSPAAIGRNRTREDEGTSFRIHPRSIGVVELGLKVLVLEPDMLDEFTASLPDFVSLFPNVENFHIRFVWHEDADELVMPPETWTRSTAAIISALNGLGTKHLKSIKICNALLDENQIYSFRDLLVESGVEVTFDGCMVLQLEEDQDDIDMEDIIRERDWPDDGYESERGDNSSNESES
jgi:hypothetical protein